MELIHDEHGELEGFTPLLQLILPSNLLLKLTSYNLYLWQQQHEDQQEITKYHHKAVLVYHGGLIAGS